MRSSRWASALVGAALVSVMVLAQSGQSLKRANELTLAGLRPGRDKLALAFKHYKEKYLSEPRSTGPREWLDSCTGHALQLDVDAAMVIQGITVSSLGSTQGKCDDRLFDALDLKSWVTGLGLRLGDTQDRAVQLYGEPNSSGPSVKGDQQLEFLYYAFDWAGSNVPQVMEVYCARDTGKVVEITLAYPSL